MSQRRINTCLRPTCGGSDAAVMHYLPGSESCGRTSLGSRTGCGKGWHPGRVLSPPPGCPALGKSHFFAGLKPFFRYKEGGRDRARRGRTQCFCPEGLHGDNHGWIKTEALPKGPENSVIFGQRRVYNMMRKTSILKPQAKYAAPALPSGDLRWVLQPFGGGGLCSCGREFLEGGGGCWHSLRRQPASCPQS